MTTFPPESPCPKCGTDLSLSALSAAPPSPRSGEPDCVMWCKSCGTVTADRECDCTRTDHPELQELVPNTESTIEALMNERLELLAQLSAAPPSPTPSGERNEVIEMCAKVAEERAASALALMNGAKRAGHLEDATQHLLVYTEAAAIASVIRALKSREVKP